MALLAVCVQAQNITGQIIDDLTGDSIPFAALRYRGHKISMASNHAGRFTIERHEGWRITFSAVGYKNRTIEVNGNFPSNVVIRLKPDAHELEGVTVKSKRHRYRRKDNPAVELMRRVIAAKKRTDLGNHPYYEYHNYQKITLVTPTTFSPLTLPASSERRIPGLSIRWSPAVTTTS